MADAAAPAAGGAAPATRGDRGGFGGRGGGERGDRRGRRGGRRGRGQKQDSEKEWQPVTKLGRLVKAGKIKSMEEIYLHSLPIKEYQIVDFFLPKLKDEVMKVRNFSTNYNLYYVFMLGKSWVRGINWDEVEGIGHALHMDFGWDILISRDI